MGFGFREQFPEKLQRFIGRDKLRIAGWNAHLYSRSMAPLLPKAATKLAS
jgi:hypothetical protein